MNSHEVEQSQLRMHHVGMLVQNIEDFLSNSFWILRSPIVHDPLQKARLCLASISIVDSSLVELIEPAGEDSPTARALATGQSLHHLCFEVSRCELADAFIHKHRLLAISEWQPAILFQGRMVRFAYSQNRELLEFVANEWPEQ